MGFRECLASAVEQGEINQKQADDLNKRFENKRDAARKRLPEAEAASAAKAELSAELRAAGLEAKRRALLQENAHKSLWSYLRSYRNLKGNRDILDGVLNLFEHFGTGKTDSIELNKRSIVSLAHGELQQLIRTFRRSHLTGKRFNIPAAQDLVRELFGHATASPQAKAMADAVARVFEQLRQRFNAAGGAIAKLEGFGLPQSHDATRVFQAGRDKWKSFIKPLLDIGRMRDPASGLPMSPERLDESLDYVWSSIATDNIHKREPSAQRPGLGAIASQRAEHRFLHFKDADAWLDYAREFGEPDPVKAIFDHVNGMAGDIAAMEKLGPNPGATVEWLTQLVQREASNKIEGKPSLYAGRNLAKVRDNLNYIPYRIQSVWQGVGGAPVVSSRTAAAFSNVRNVLTSAQLGSAALVAATTDPFFDAMTRHLSGLPVTKSMGVILKTFSEGTREEAVRAGMVMDEFLHSLQEGARYTDIANGTEATKWLADRTMQLSALEPMTQARRHMFALDYMGAVADRAGKSFDELDPTFGRWLEGYGITPDHWDAIRATPQFKTDAGAAGIIRPADVSAAGHRQAAERMLGMIYGQTERAVPTSTIRSKSFATGLAPKGTITGELLQGFLQYKSFGLSLMTLQLQALAMEGGLGSARGLGYAAALFTAMTVGGAMGMQLRNLASGKDLQPMDDKRFWMAAAQTGGGFGIFGDFLFSDASRFGHSLTETAAGPLAGLASDFYRDVVGGAQKAVGGAQGENTGGRDLTSFIGRYTPVASSLWYARLAYKRLVLDQLQYATDPKAHKRFREQERRAQHDTGQGFWWRPGEAAPGRLPDLMNAAP